MKILSIAIYASDNKPAICLDSQQDTSQFSFFQASSIKEFLIFFSNTVADRNEPGARQSVQEQNHMAHVYTRVAPDTVTGVIIADEEYPSRVAFSLLNKILDEYTTQVPRDVWTSSASNARATNQPRATGAVTFQPLAGYLAKYQDPKQADSIMRVQQELDETKIVMHKTIESVLERGERIDSLVDKSNQLSYSSKAFFKQSKKQNSCCNMS